MIVNFAHQMALYSGGNLVIFWIFGARVIILGDFLTDISTRNDFRSINQ